MRTQLILTTAAIGVASSLGAIGQVYSVNAVGYINITVGAKKYALVSNQLNVGGNTLKEVLPSVAEGTVVFKHSQASGFAAIGFEFGEWGNPNATVKPGEGFFLQNNGAADLKVTFVGEVPQGALKTGLLKGLNLIGSQVPQAGKLDALEYPVGDETVYQFVSGNYAGSDALGGTWLGDAPTVSVAESFFVLNNEPAKNWTRSFTIN